MLFWDEHNKFINDEYGDVKLTEKPAMPFEYGFMRYVVNGEQWYTDSNNAKVGIPQEHIKYIDGYILAMRMNHGIKVSAVDSNGYYLGVVDSTDSRIAEIVSFPPTDEPWIWRDNEWIRVWYITDDGILTTQEKSTKEVITNTYPTGNNTYWDESTNDWVDKTSVAEHRFNGMKYIIDVLCDIIGDKVNDRQLFVKSAVDAVVESSKPYISSDEYQRLKQNVGYVVEEVSEFCENPSDIAVSVTTLVINK